MVLVAMAGLGAVLFLVKLEPGDRNLRFDWNPFTTYVAVVREMSKTRLLTVALAWGYFYLLAGMALLIIPEYTTVLAIDRAKASLLLGVMAVGIGIGSGVAGFVSGHRIEPRLIPVGAAGLSVFFILLGVVPATFTNVAVFIGAAGFFAGFYIIPLQAMLQDMSPDDERGRFLGTANAISFGFLSLASAIYWIIRPIFQTRPEAIFLVSAGLMICGAGFFALKLRRSGPILGG
jgi:acyl-[acyl-carrier-protein]-phospholipid O-acyltransferase/long-chain-fatty-acid--[acyl-carrier-protein] ligase